MATRGVGMRLHLVLLLALLGAAASFVVEDWYRNLNHFGPLATSDWAFRKMTLVADYTYRIDNLEQQRAGLCVGAGVGWRVVEGVGVLQPCCSVLLAAAAFPRSPPPPLDRWSGLASSGLLPSPPARSPGRASLRARWPGFYGACDYRIVRSRRILPPLLLIVPKTQTAEPVCARKRRAPKARAARARVVAGQYLRCRASTPCSICIVRPTRAIQDFLALYKKSSRLCRASRRRLVLPWAAQRPTLQRSARREASTLQTLVSTRWVC